MTVERPGHPTNPHVIYRDEPITPDAERRLRALGYGEERLRLLREGLPLTYYEDGALVVEYPSGRRVEVQRRDVHRDGIFVRYEYDVIRELTARPR